MLSSDLAWSEAQSRKDHRHGKEGGREGGGGEREEKKIINSSVGCSIMDAAYEWWHIGLGGGRRLLGWQVWSVFHRVSRVHISPM